MPRREGANFATRFVNASRRDATPSSKPAGAVTIGRAADNDIVVPDVLASRYHATLTLTPLGTEIRDTSVNGTFVNGTRVGSAILSEGDVVTVGNIDLVVRAACWSAAAKPRPRPAPAAWKCATSSTSSRTANNCSTTSR